MSETTATRTATGWQSRRLRAAAVAAALLWAAFAALLWRTSVPGELAVPGEAALPVAAAEVERAEGYGDVARLLRLGGLAAQLAALAALVRVARPLAARVRGRPLARSLQLLAVALAAGWLARLPFRLASHWWRRRHDLSRQGYLDFVATPWLELAAFSAAAAVALVLAILLWRRLGSRWWLAGAPLLAALGSALVLAQPLVLAPRLEPLRDDALAADIERLARATGAGEVETVVEDASERTRTLNAEVAGIGPTRRVVLWDTTLARVPRAELRFLVAHELAHTAHRHLWKGLAWFALLAPVLTWAVARAARPLGGIARPEAVPAAALALVALELAVLPGANVVSRRYEREADWTALEATRGPAAARSLLARFVRENLADPDPPGWAQTLLATHPSLEQRAALAAAWAARAGPREQRPLPGG